IDAALSARADGVCYVLAGANPASSTPMQYGGHFLEVDREILTDCQDAAFNLLWVRGKEEPYLDFVIDLPAHAFAWDMVATGITPSAMKQARGGAVAGAHPEADIYLVDHHSTAAPWLEAATP
ncbi:MAG: hypothetical protein MH204_03565, partial [Fimbriimonadaceae bacterium]|nr:hypothetical protein [Fimbriimonadaceae bacterium]